MHYLNISFSHKNSTLDVREKLSYKDDYATKGCLSKLNSGESINESILISTCNRMEVFCSCSDIASATKHIFEMLAARSGVSIDELEGRADIFDDSSAIHHLFSVASSLDSMVIGETQIAGQLKDAFRFSYDNGFCSQKLARAMHHAFKCAAKVRNATDISSKPVSIASVAVSKLKSVLDNVEGKKALVIGVGEMSEITAKHLLSSGADVYITNRTKHKAEKLASECGAKVLDMQDLHKAVNEFEILFTATSSSEPIITDEIIKPCDFDRYWFDMAVPRDINYHKGDRINLYVVDDLKNIVDQNMSFREDGARKAHGIIGRSTVEFFEWLNTLNIEPMIKEIYEKAFEAARIESQRVIKKGFIPKEYEDQIHKMSQQVLKRFLHQMSSKMRSVSEESKADMLTSAVQFLIEKDQRDIPDKYKCEHALNIIEGR
ncbi:glutamyl-tRNA reductase [Sulfurimonas denitrificans DSM 1251]|jgi:glutamyl-tRNA reductase|uniref:Glutamyl-tRNA reductase n=1 Tax=Sulfurimonas denitrificans (strain ATCC 33889 / DSM 1251) TaxID=326298 RepID=HEM1_SULDN|nr:glutamyl-tRNA reductase [Sulfurimonas denitrificans]Q30S94.1 RecName: Full=Glutamyl-tRNA reductase; Short=GluTR [Sulfurimonas denitrificans DSM 1251]ABB44137.1 glutamyl-tRNA reductase [Sulfurimonas denitrificans DSM 1251]MDD3441854.1 glutamyl-tRNA reductase [Sulfurimonas denitrificans]